MDNQLISVILPTYNEPKYIVDLALTSILVQSYTNIEILVILDNPSNVEIKKYLEEKCLEDSRIRLIINPSNFGLVKSLNIGIKNSNGYYIARMDADDISHKERLNSQKKFLCDNELDFVYSGMKHIDESGKTIAEDKYSKLSTKKLNFLLKYGNISNHPTWLFKKEIFYKLSGYRSIPYCEDYDFILRAVLFGFKIGRMESNCLDYRHRSNSISRQNNLNQMYNTYLISKAYRKNKLLKFSFEHSLSNNKIKYSIIRFRKYYEILDKYNATDKLISKTFFLLLLMLHPVTRNYIFFKAFRKIVSGDSNA